MIGIDAQFHETHGYHAQGVSVTTAILPIGWMERLVAVDTARTKPARGLCLEAQDCVVSKLVAGGGKDRDFAGALLREGLVDAKVLLERIDLLRDVNSAQKERLRAWVNSHS